jgi:hypothetical protein
MPDSTPLAPAPAGPMPGPSALPLWGRLSRSPLRALLAAAVGGGGMAAYAHFVGCRTGTCPLTSNVWVASLYGAVVGALVGWPQRRGAEGR